MGGLYFVRAFVIKELPKKNLSFNGKQLLTLLLKTMGMRATLTPTPQRWRGMATVKDDSIALCHRLATSSQPDSLGEVARRLGRFCAGYQAKANLKKSNQARKIGHGLLPFLLLVSLFCLIVGKCSIGMLVSFFFLGLLASLCFLVYASFLDFQGVYLVEKILLSTPLSQSEQKLIVKAARNAAWIEVFPSPLLFFLTKNSKKSHFFPKR